MNTDAAKLEFDREKFDRWIQLLAECEITDEELECLFRMWEAGLTEPRTRAAVEGLSRQLVAATHSFCHIESIMRGYQDEDVDLETSRQLLAKRTTGEPYSNEEIRVLGKRSSDPEAERNLRSACWDLLHGTGERADRPLSPFPVCSKELHRKLTDEQFMILAESAIGQIVVHATNRLTDVVCWWPNAYTNPDLKRRLYSAYWISLLTEHVDNVLWRSKAPLGPDVESEICEKLSAELFGVSHERPSRRRRPPEASAQ